MISRLAFFPRWHLLRVFLHFLFLQDYNIAHHTSLKSMYYHFFTRNVDKMEAAAAGVSGQRLSSSGGNAPVAAEMQNAASGSSKTNLTGSETGQTGVAGSSSSNVKATVSSTPAASATVGMLQLRHSLNLWPNFVIFGQVMSCFGCVIISSFFFLPQKTWQSRQ